MTIRSNAAWRAGLALCVGMLLRPSDAAAHLVTTGMGPVYDGIGHLLLTPEDLVPVLALALYAGLRGAADGRRTSLPAGQRWTRPIPMPMPWRQPVAITNPML